jgi:catechol 2,3-dioxygenase-like lactoylglutathione lyase family enzyme
MIETLKSQITFLGTVNLPETAKFYEQILGLELALDQGCCRIYATCKGGFIGFCERENAPATDGVIFTLVTDDVDKWHEHLVAHGVKIERTPWHNPEFQIYHCLFRDNNGYLLEIQRFEDPRWTG